MFTGYDAKKLLKSANIWQSYSKNKSGPVFLTLSVEIILLNVIVSFF